MKIDGNHKNLKNVPPSSHSSDSSSNGFGSLTPLLKKKIIRGRKNLMAVPLRGRGGGFDKGPAINEKITLLNWRKKKSDGHYPQKLLPLSNPFKILLLHKTFP